MSFGFFAIGCLFLVAGVAYLAHLMELPQAYVVGLAVAVAAVVAATGLQKAHRGRI